MQQREDIVFLQLLAAFEKIEFYYEGQTGDISAERLRELHGCRAGPARSEQIIDDDYSLSAADCIFVHLERVAAVFELICDLCGLRWQLLRLTNRHESGVEAVGERGTENEASRLDSQNEINIFLHVVCGERIDQSGKADLVFEQRGDVVKEDSWFGKIGNFANQLLEMIAVDCLRL